MVKFCSNCGKALEEGAKFCPECGAAVEPPAQGTAAGFSNRVNDPEILAAVRKNRKAAGGFSVIWVLLPLIGFPVYSLFSNKLELKQAVIYGAVLSGIFLVFALYGWVKGRAKNTYEATVIDKKTRLMHRHNDSESEYTEYVTVVRTADGKKTKIVERDGSQLWAWEYLNVGDRFKYHPQFAFPYELYDKSKAPYIVCVGCGAQNYVEADRCGKCGLPLLK